MRQVAHLVFSDGLVAVSVFVEPIGGAPHPSGLSQQGGINVYIRQFDENLVTVLGEAPPATVRQIAHSVARR
jgi:sigma-E factor negative regulatory protein RseB